MTEADEPRQVAFLITLPVAGMLLGVLLAAFALGGWRLSAIQHDYTNRIAASAVKVGCVTGNDFRMLDKARWDSVIDLFGPPPHRADLQRIIDAIDGQTKKADVQRDCRKIEPTKPQPVATTTVPKKR